MFAPFFIFFCQQIMVYVLKLIWNIKAIPPKCTMNMLDLNSKKKDLTCNYIHENPNGSTEIFWILPFLFCSKPPCKCKKNINVQLFKFRINLPLFTDQNKKHHLIISITKLIKWILHYTFINIKKNHIYMLLSKFD